MSGTANWFVPRERQLIVMKYVAFSPTHDGGRCDSPRAFRFENSPAIVASMNVGAWHTIIFNPVFRTGTGRNLFPKGSYLTALFPITGMNREYDREIWTARRDRPCRAVPAEPSLPGRPRRGCERPSIRD